MKKVFLSLLLLVLVISLGCTTKYLSIPAVNYSSSIAFSPLELGKDYEIITGKKVQKCGWTFFLFDIIFAFTGTDPAASLQREAYVEILEAAADEADAVLPMTGKVTKTNYVIVSKICAEVKGNAIKIKRR